MLYPFGKNTGGKNTGFVTGAALALVLAGGTAAQAQTFTFVGTGDSKVVTISDNGGASYINGYTGRYQGQLGAGPNVNIFCVDLTHEIHSGDTYAANTDYKITSSAGSLNGGYYQGGLSSALTNGDLASATAAQAAARSSEVAYLADNFLNAANFTNASGSTDTGSNLTAISLSIWDIVRDGGDGLTSGLMRAGTSDAGAYSSLVGYYEGLAAGHTNYTSSAATWIQAPQQTLGQHLQDYVYTNASVPPSGPQAVPEPGMPMFLSCLSLVLGGLWLRRRQHKTARS